MILIAYVALQRKHWPRDGATYLSFNLIGSLLLLVVAILDRQLGFIVLEGAWAAASVDSLVRRAVRAR
ncbi:MAG TPA: hypothetical protein VGA22_13000 [Gemmatimonadales bacterium]